MNFIHVTDTHFGLNSYGTENPSVGFNTRADDAFQAYDQMIKYAKKNDIKLIIHSGDFYNTKTVSQNIVAKSHLQTREISEAGIDYYVLHGNHDASRILVNKNGLDVAGIFDLKGVHISRGEDEVLDLGYAQICSVSYWDTSEEIEAKIAKHAKAIDWSRPAILVVHLQIEYANFPGSFREDLHFTPLSLLTSHPWTYVAAGHIHKPQMINADPPVYYGGSLVRCSFAEESDKKGFNVIKLAGPKVVSIKKQPVDCLRMLTLRGTMAQVRDSLDGVDPTLFTNTIVRCIIEEDDELLDEKFLKDKLCYAFKAVISKEAKKTEQIRMERGTNMTSMNDALRVYFKDDEEADALMLLVEELREQDAQKVLER